MVEDGYATRRERTNAEFDFLNTGGADFPESGGEADIGLAMIFPQLGKNHCPVSKKYFPNWEKNEGLSAHSAYPFFTRMIHYFIFKVPLDVRNYLL